MLKGKQKPNQQNTHMADKKTKTKKKKNEKTVFLESTQDTQSNDIHCILTESI